MMSSQDSDSVGGGAAAGSDMVSTTNGREIQKDQKKVQSC